MAKRLLITPGMIWALLALGWAQRTLGQDTRAKGVETGVVLPNVAASEAGQSYALYVPKGYSAAKRWPMVYAFDPGARGSVPVELMKDAAERYGYLVAASNNSRNGPFEPDAKAAQAMWSDTHTRFSIDDSRVYFAGFSGGARVAAQLAQLCKCVSGVFLSGAGFPIGAQPSKAAMFPVFMTAGLTDFNYGELVRLDEQLDSLGFVHFLRRFDGRHQWAPAEIWPQAFAWADLLTMKAKTIAKDDAFLSAEAAKFLEQEQKFEQDGDVYFAAAELHEMVAVLDGLTDTSAWRQRLAVLEKNPQVASGKKHENEDIEQQQSLESDVVRVLARLQDGNVTERNDVLEEAGKAIGRLRDRALHEKNQEKNQEKKRVLERARVGLFAFLIETGEPLIDSKDLGLARIYLELAAEARPESSWPQVSLARCFLKMGRKKDALLALKRAREAGLSSEELIGLTKSYPEFSALASEADYQKLAN